MAITNMVGMMYIVCIGRPCLSEYIFAASIMHHSSEGVFPLCNILDLFI